MKKLTKTLLITLILVAICAAFFACDFSENTKPQPVVSYSVQFAQAEISMTVGDRIELPAVYVFKSVDGASSAIDAQCTYSISEEDVAILNSEGKLVALKQGTTTLVAKYQNATAVLVVNVNAQTKQDITITFESGCEIPSVTRKVSGNTVILPSISERKGYTFDGWQTPDGVKKSGDSISAPKNDVTITATWTKIAYSITYVLNGGTNDSSNPDTYYVDSNAIVLNYPSKTNAKFDGWYKDAAFTERIALIAKGTVGNITLYAKFNDYPIASFDGGQGATGSVSDIVLENGTQITLPKNDFTKKGYDFVGWNDGSNTYQAGANYTLTSSTTFTAQWQAVDYTIAYHLDGGVNNQGNPASYKITDSNITLLDATKSGYNFAGWYSDATFCYPIESIDTSKAQNVEVYAKFSLLLDVSFDANGGEGQAPSTIRQSKNGKITLPENTFTNVEGFFAGWFDGKRVYRPGDTYVVTKDVAFKAQWLGNFEIGAELFDLASGGYTIVYQNDEYAKSAAESIKTYIKQTLGVNISAVCEVNYTGFDYETSKIISVGKTSVFNCLEHFKWNGNIVNSEQLISSAVLVSDSFAIASDRYVICLIANNQNGILYAADQFVEDNLGIRFLTAEYTYVPQITSANIMAQCNTFAPQFEYRQYLNTSTFYPSTSENIKYSQHLRFNGDYITSGNSGIGGFEWYTDAAKGIGTAHNTISFVKPSDYSKYENTMFFKYNGNIIDVCYTDGITSSGTIDRSTSAIDTAAEAMYAALYDLLANTDKDNFWLSVGQADTNERCECSDCIAATKQYNRSGITVRFWNAIINELENCGNAKVRNKNYRLVMFAYQYNLLAPVIDGKTDSTCIPNNEHLWVRIAPIVVDRYLALDDENQPLLQRENGRTYDSSTMLGHVSASTIYSDWAKVTSNLFSWTYSPDFGNYFAYTGAVVNMKRNLTLLKNSGVDYAFIQGVFNEKTHADQYLEAYVFSKLCWNPDADATKLRNEFLKYYYGEIAYEKVKQYYDNFDAEYARRYSTSGTGSNGFVNVYEKNKISDSFYLAQIELLDQAASVLSQDCASRLSQLKLIPLFMLAKQNSNYRTEFSTLFESMGGVHISEGNTMSNFVW